MDEMTEDAHRVLIVDDEKDFCELLFRILTREGLVPLVAHDGPGALEMISSGVVDAVLLDVRMPGMDGLEVLRRARKLNADLPILMLTAHAGFDGAVLCMKEGASDYLTKPVQHGEIIEKLKRALSERPGGKKGLPSSYSSKRSERLAQSLEELMGPSEAIRSVISAIKLVAPSNFTVIIQGETGTGKELVARAIHQGSPRSKQPMVPLDCGAITESLFESELFGHEKGSFTGASGKTAGKFEIAEGGTLFLDEIANMPFSSQIKLLRAIQEKNFFRVGGRETVNVDVRLIVATNQDLSARIERGYFSRDLFYRLSEFTINIKPLRERKDDILHLSKRFLEATNLELNKSVRGFSKSAVQVLIENEWPGNVRELRSVIRRAVLSAGNLIEPKHLLVEKYNVIKCLEVTTFTEEMSWVGLSLKEIVRHSTSDVERRVLSQVLRKTRGNKAVAARLLQIDYKTIHKKIKQYGINPYLEEDNGQEE
jgi:DNA-binding NtrC family response regulator